MPRNFTLAATVLSMICLALAGCGDPSSDQAGSDNSPQAQPGQTLTEVDIEGLQDAIQASADAGKITIVEYWATWCPPCIALIAPLHAAMHERGDDIRIIGVSLDGREKLQAAAETLTAQERVLQERHNIDADLFKHALILPDPDQQNRIITTFGQELDAISPPMIYIYRPDGSLHREIIGSDWKALLQRITAAVDEIHTPT